MRALWRLCTWLCTWLCTHALCAQSKTIRCPHLIAWKLKPGLVLLLQSASQDSMAVVLITMPQNLMVFQRLGKKKKKKDIFCQTIPEKSTPHFYLFHIVKL